MKERLLFFQSGPVRETTQTSWLLHSRPLASGPFPSLATGSRTGLWLCRKLPFASVSLSRVLLLATQRALPNAKGVNVFKEFATHYKAFLQKSHICLVCFLNFGTEALYGAELLLGSKSTFNIKSHQRERGKHIHLQGINRALACVYQAHAVLRVDACGTGLRVQVEFSCSQAEARVIFPTNLKQSCSCKLQ